jgi:hypothetical protein
MLYALLAGCGPAGGEAPVEYRQDLSEDCRRLRSAKAKRGVIQPFLKTKNGTREVDLCSSLAKELQASHRYERHFGATLYKPQRQTTAPNGYLRDSLHPSSKRWNTKRVDSTFSGATG